MALVYERCIFKMHRKIPDLLCLHTQKLLLSVASAMNAVPAESNFIARGGNGKDFFLCQILPHSA